MKYNDIGLWLVSETKKRLKVSFVSVMLLDEKEKELVIIASIGLPKDIIKRTREGIQEGIAGYVANTKEALLIEDIKQDIRFMRKSRKRYWTKSLISCPIKHNNILFGVLNVNNKIDKSDFTDEDLKEVEALANEGAIKFSFASVEDLKKKSYELESLLSFLRNILLSSYISEIIKYTQDVLLKLLNPEIITIVIIPPKKIYLATNVRLKEVDLQEFLSHKISLFTPFPPDISTFSLEITGLDVKPSKMRFKSLLSSSISLPIIVNNYEFGLLSIARKSPFSREDLKNFAIILNYLAITFSKIRPYQNLNDDLKKTKDELIHQEKMAAVGKVTEKISHDLRNPLSVILLSVILAKKGKNDDEVLDLLSRIERAGITMERLIEDVSTFAKEIKIKRKNISIAKVIENSFFLLENKLSDIEKKIDIAFSDLIPADDKRLEQVFTNLIINAIQAMDGKGVLKIKVEKDGDFLRTDISDTGHGIAPEIKNMVFESFFTTKTKGLGLGLSIVKDIIEKHSGRIELESELGKGSCFKIFLPVK